MIELFFCPTPNCWKVAIFLEEARLPYRVTPVRLAAGEQFKPEFIRHAPNNRVPAIVDHAPAEGGALSLFESGAILWYLANKSGRFVPSDPAGQATTLQWLMWQMAGLGPMLGQHGHFLLYAAERHAYALDRYRNEAKRLYGVLDRQLASTGAHVAGAEYGIADMACFPWVMTHKKQQISLDEFPHVADWFARLRTRDGIQRGLAVARDQFEGKLPDGEERRRFFGISAPESAS